MSLCIYISLSLLAAAAAYRPGVPPQCFDEYQCVFYRFNLGGLEYSWDLRALCANTNSEYRSPNNNNPPGQIFPQIRFNICGTVAKPIAPLSNDQLSQRLPLPHSHGIAIRYIDDPDNPAENPNNVQTVDVDSCDQATNPTCLYGSQNYPVTANPGATEQNTRRATQCLNDPSYYYCNVLSAAVTDNQEVISFYDGASPIFALYDESNPRGGINLTFPGATAYTQDPFPCGGVDPATGNPPLRSVCVLLSARTTRFPTDLT